MPDTQKYTPGDWRYKYQDHYLALARKAHIFLSTPGNTIRLSWCGALLDADAWRIEFTRALNRRINLKSRRLTGRKFTDGYLTGIRRDRRIIENYKRNIMYRGMNVLVTQELQKRYPHINNNPGMEF